MPFQYRDMPTVQGLNETGDSSLSGVQLRLERTWCLGGRTKEVDIRDPSRAISLTAHSVCVANSHPCTVDFSASCRVS